MTSLIALGKCRLAMGTAAGFFGLAIQLLVELLSAVLTRSWCPLDTLPRCFPTAFIRCRRWGTLN